MVVSNALSNSFMSCVSLFGIVVPYIEYIPIQVGNNMYFEYIIPTYLPIELELM